MPTIIVSIVSFAVGAVVGYLVLRNNPRVKAVLDTAADKGEGIIDRD